MKITLPKLLTSLAFWSAIFLTQQKLFAQSSAWSTSQGGNGHYYEVISQELTWFDAKSSAEARGGYLATITSAEENNFVYNLVKNNIESRLTWLGGYQPDGQTWTWTTNEPFTYTNWATGEPNNLDGIENYIQLFSTTASEPSKWNDGWYYSPTPAYVVEYNTPPPSRLFGLTVGQNAGFDLRGDKGADRVFDKLSQASTWVRDPSQGNSTEPLIFTDNFTQNLGAQVTSSLNSMNVRAGDTVVFYYNGHGGPLLDYGDGGESPVQIDGASNSRDEFFASDLSDDSLYQLFSQPKWADVRKIFLLDSCHSGGFLGTAGASDIGDLEKLSNFAFFASATEEADAYNEDSFLSFALGEFGNYGMGVWTARGLLPALDVESLTTASLESLINGNLNAAISDYASGSHFAFDINDPSARAFSGFNTTTIYSGDFDTSQSLIPIPEPTTAMLLLFGGALTCITACRTRRCS